MPRSAPPPRMIVIAGPSGSGKSTFFPVADAGDASFNIDDRCAELNGGSYREIPPEVREQAQQECQDFIESCTRDLRSFAVETTLRTDIAIQQAMRARSAGFRIEMVFVATDDVDENVLRVARRALDGGHSAPASRIREIYALSLANLPDAIRIFDEVILYDSTAFAQLPRLVARFVNGRLATRSPELPRWCTAGSLHELVGE
jgi:predicted ABC-type ATPase